MLLLKRTDHPVPFVLLLAGLSASPLIAANLYLPSFPAMMMAFHASIGDLQLSASLFIAFFALSQFLSGVLADRFGRRRIVLLGLSIYVLGSFIILVPHALNILYLGRCLQGLGAGAGTALSRVMLRDRFTGQKLTKMFIFIAAMIVLAPAIAPFLGGIIEYEVGYYGNLVALLILGVSLLLMTGLLLPETMTNQQHTLGWRDTSNALIRILCTPRFLYYTLTNSLMTTLVISYTIITPFVYHLTFHLNAAMYGDIMLGIAMGMFIGMLLNTLLIRYLQANSIIGLGLIIILCSTLLLFSLTPLDLISVLPVSLGLFMMNVGIALVLPNAASQAFNTFSQSIGLVGALYGGMRMAISALSGFCIAYLHIQSLYALSVLLIIVSLIALAMCGLAKRLF